MKRSAFRRRQAFTIIELALALVTGSVMLMSMVHTSREFTKATSNVYDETFLQTVTRDVQLNLDKSMNMVNRAGVPNQIVMSSNSMIMGGAQIRFSPRAQGQTDPGGKLEYSADNGTTWASMADIGSRGMFDNTEFAYGKFVANEDTGIPTPDRPTYVLDERVRDSLLRVTTVLKKQDMVPLYLQVARAPRALTWSWVENSVAGNPLTDSDGDGVMDDKDDLPLNPALAFRERFPSGAGKTASLAFEDLYPDLGDADYNDLVTAFFLTESYGPGDKDAAAAVNRPALKEVYMRYFAQARGAGYNHAFKVNLGQLVVGGGSASVQRFDPWGRLIAEETLNIATQPVVEVFPDTRTQLPPSSDTWSTNVRPGTTIRQAWTTVIRVTLATPNSNRYGFTQAPPYDPYLTVKNTNRDIHLPLYDSNGDGSNDAYRASNGTVTNMIDAAGNPWAILVPTTWRWPLEGQTLDVAFPEYKKWREAGRPESTDWYDYPLEARYKISTNNPGFVVAPSPNAAWRSIDDVDGLNRARYVYVFDPKLFTDGEEAFLAPTSTTTTAPLASAPPASALPTPAPTPTPTPTPGAANLHPIALHVNKIAGKVYGDPLPDIYVGSGAGNFGWLSWDGDGSAPRLATSLKYPGDSHTYTNPLVGGDTEVNVGDWIRGNTGVSNSSSVRSNLDKLKEYDIIVPVWDTATGSGSGTRYHCVAFAKVRITNYRLSGTNRISAIYKGYADNRGQPSTAPTPVPSGAPSATPAPTPTPSATPVPSNNVLPIGIGSAMIAGRSSGYTFNNKAGDDSTSSWCYLSWTGDTAVNVLGASMILPGNSGSYRNPSNNADTHLDAGDRVEIQGNNLSNGQKHNLNPILDNVIVVPVFNTVSSGRITISGFCKIRVTDRDCSESPDELDITYLGMCNSAGN